MTFTLLLMQQLNKSIGYLSKESVSIALGIVICPFIFSHVCQKKCYLIHLIFSPGDDCKDRLYEQHISVLNQKIHNTMLTNYIISLKIMSNYLYVF